MTNIKFWFVDRLHCKPIVHSHIWINPKITNFVGSKLSTWQNIADFNINKSSWNSQETIWTTVQGVSKLHTTRLWSHRTLGVNWWGIPYTCIFSTMEHTTQSKPYTCRNWGVGTKMNKYYMKQLNINCAYWNYWRHTYRKVLFNLLKVKHRP